MSVINEMMAAMRDPQTRHAAMVHAPIVLTGVSAAVVAALAATGGRNRTLRWVAASLLASAIGAAFLATNSGDDARHALGPAPKALKSLVHEHEEAAEKVWIFVAVALAGVAATWARQRALSTAALAVAVLAAGAGAGWTAYVAHLGGTAVYTYGAGTPKPLTEADLHPAAAPRIALADPRAEFFRDEVRPILASNCAVCHDASKDAAAGLDLTTIAGALRGGESGRAVVPGRSSDSILWQSVNHTHPKIRMPKSSPKLAQEQIDKIARWIDDGAVGAPE